MKLFRYGKPGEEKPGVILPNGEKIDATGFGQDYNEVFFATGGLQKLKTWVDKEGKKAPKVSDHERLGPSVARPSKIVCIGLNYVDHAKESGAEPPSEPVLFFKSTTALCGPNDDLLIPRNSQKTDWEVELALVMERKAKYVSEADAMKYVAGFVLHNDYSEREFQMERKGQWVKGKSCDSFAPLGPFLATTDEVPDFQNLGMWLTVNGKTMQKSSSSNMIFQVPFLVSYISRFMTLLPGDVISTGTPAGVGLGMKPPLYLKAGDVIELGIDQLGSSKQKAIQET